MEPREEKGSPLSRWEEKPQSQVRVLADITRFQLDKNKKINWSIKRESNHILKIVQSSVGK